MPFLDDLPSMVDGLIDAFSETVIYEPESDDPAVELPAIVRTGAEIGSTETYAEVVFRVDDVPNIPVRGTGVHDDLRAFITLRGIRCRVVGNTTYYGDGTLKVTTRVA